MSTLSGFTRLLAVTTLLAGASTAWAQDDESLDDLDLDDLIGGPAAPAPTPGQETQELLREADAPEQVPVATAKKRVIQTLQRKDFMKLGRYELGLRTGFVTNDPFINRYLASVSAGYHVTEIFAIEFDGAFSPNLGDRDWKPITHQIIEENQVTPDISKIQFYGSLNFQFSPIYGKLAVGTNKIIKFDIFGVFGTGVVNTRDDLEALQNFETNATNTEVQLHPTLNYGGGLRVALSPSFALRLEGRGLSYIEVLESTTLEMKNNMTLLAGVSFFLPGME